MQDEPLQRAHQEILNELHNLYSFLVIRKGVIVFEQYYQGHDANSLFDVRSVTKSFISTLLGIALRERNSLHLDQTILSYFPEYQTGPMDPRKAAITIKDVLTMKSGIAWVEEDEFEWLYSSDNWIQYILSRPMADNPGSVFNYNSGGSHLLSELIRRATGMDALEFAQQRLFSHLGIQNADWEIDPMGIPFGFGECTKGWAKIER
jgi:CubicO group peptidase (beta-lactamase class C family)